MKKWEYRIIDTKEVPGAGIIPVFLESLENLFSVFRHKKTPPDKSKSRRALEAYLNELGEQGWEIVNFDALEWRGCMAFRGVAKRERQ